MWRECQAGRPEIFFTYLKLLLVASGNQVLLEHSLACFKLCLKILNTTDLGT